jgi:hypothetical protein
MRIYGWILFVLCVVIAPRPAAADDVNACGCYRSAEGSCICTKTKKMKCACPGDCEPVGCEAQRQKQADKEADAALKRINAKEKQKSAAAANQAKKTGKKTTKSKAAASAK